MATLGGVDLGDVQSENQNKDSGLFNMPIPASDSSSTLLLDLFGTTRTINIDGKFVGTKAEIKTFISAIDAIQDGSQSGSTFVSDLSTSTPTVYIQNWGWTYSAADVGKINYTLSLIEGIAT